MSKAGIIGGTFNPIHNGHILLALYCKEKLNLDSVIFIPTYTPPHKSDKELVSEVHRINMCNIAVESYNDFSVSDIEIKRKGKSYTYETLTSLKEIYPDDTLYFITGADMFLTLEKWKNPEIFFEKAIIAAVPRNSSDSEVLNSHYQAILKPMGAKACILDEPVMSVSSTFIRENIENYDLIKSLIDRNVYEYIVKNNLYRE